MDNLDNAYAELKKISDEIEGRMDNVLIELGKIFGEVEKVLIEAFAWIDEKRNELE